MSKKKKEITNDQTAVSDVETDGEYWCWLDMKMKPFPVWRVNEITKNLRAWLDKCDISKGEGLRINQFYDSQNITERDYYRLVEKYSSLKDAHDSTLMKIAERRETGALLGKLNPNVVMRYQPMYDKGVVKMMEWQAKIAKQEEQSKMNLTVLLGKSEETDVVPPKKVKE